MPLIKCAVKAKLTFQLLRIDIRNHQTDKNLFRNFISPLTIICCGNGVCHSRGSGNPAFTLWAPVPSTSLRTSFAVVTSSVLVFRNRN